MRFVYPFVVLIFGFVICPTDAIPYQTHQLSFGVLPKTAPLPPSGPGNGINHGPSSPRSGKALGVLYFWGTTTEGRACSTICTWQWWKSYSYNSPCKSSSSSQFWDLNQGYRYGIRGCIIFLILIYIGIDMFQCINLIINCFSVTS